MVIWQVVEISLVSRYFELTRYKRISEALFQAREGIDVSGSYSATDAPFEMNINGNELVCSFLTAHLLISYMIWK
jgi:hypothetical protein